MTTQGTSRSDSGGDTLRRWQELKQFQERRVSLPAAGEAPKLCVTMSREAGARGTSVARLVGQKLGWVVYDQELLEYISQQGHLRTGLLETLDDECRQWVRNYLAGLLKSHWHDQDSYIVRLALVIMAIGMHGEAVVVGRGAGCILPPERALRVRLVGALAERTAYISQTERQTPQEAERLVRERDSQRRRFVRDYFGRDIDDPHEYDMVLDAGMLGEELCAELIAAAVTGKRQFWQKKLDIKARPTPVPAEHQSDSPRG